MVDGTFSILAISPDSKFMGVALASGSTLVGDKVPYTKPGVGVIATQAYTNVIYGTRGLDLLAKGLSPQETLNKLLGEDSEKDSRQVAIMDFKKRKAVFTGVKSPEYSAEKVGQDYIVIGNLLSSKEVVDNMAKHFEFSLDSLARKMVSTLKAGSKSGGDKRARNQ